MKPITKLLLLNGSGVLGVIVILAFEYSAGELKAAAIAWLSLAMIFGTEVFINDSKEK